MTTSPTTSGLLGIGWCTLVPFVVVAVYLAIGTGAVLLIGEPIAATAVLGVLVVVLVGGVRILQPQWLAHAPVPRTRAQTPHFGRTVLGCAVLAFLAGQALALWIYVTAGSAGFEESNQTRRAAGALAVFLLTMVAAPAGRRPCSEG